jgi:hypothetical protein
MRARLLLLLIAFALPISLSIGLVQAEDGIPDNCENPRAEYYRAALFARYEPQNRRLVLVDWNTATDVLELAANVDDTLVRGWSWNCRYLAVATGNDQNRSTVVYDTDTGVRIGEVPDAQVVPHTITWGPDSFLVIETRNGAVVWDVEKNQQYHYDTGFHTTLHRNFTQLRWDSENHQLIGNLALGGRLVIDLTTGQETVVASSTRGEIIIGGERFLCRRVNYYDPELYAHSVEGLRLEYSREGGVIYLARGGYGTRSEVMATIEANVDALSVRALGWSANCRYLAATIGVPGQDDVWQTVVWEFETRRRVGSFDDAHDIPHPITWDTAENHLLVQTRFGAYLWHLETNERVLVTDYVEQVCASSYSCRDRVPKSFHQVYWDAGRQQMLAVPLAAPDTVVAYDVNTGTDVTRYTIEGAAQPLTFITSNDSRLLITYSGERLTVWNRESGTQSDLDYGDIGTAIRFMLVGAISTDNHYFAYMYGNRVYIWDLYILTPNMLPTHVYSDNRLSPAGIYFVNGDTLDMGHPSRTVRINVANGTVSVIDPFNPLAQNPVSHHAIDGISGYSVTTSQAAHCPQLPYRDERQLYLHNVQTGEMRLIADDINTIRYLSISPDCRTLYAEIQLLNTSQPYNETPATVSTSEYRRWVQSTFWDVESGQLFLTFEEPPMQRAGRSRISWSPDGERALFSQDTCCGYKHFLLDTNYVIDIRQQTAVPMRFIDSDSGYFPADSEVYWDYSRGLIYIEGFGEVFAVDIVSGEERLRFPVSERGRGGCYYTSSRGCDMQISADGQWIFVYGNSVMSVWNIDTLQHASVPVQSSGSERGGYISPDGRYLIVARSAVRVWDLTALTEDFAVREPIMFGFGAQSYLSLNFVDNTTIEMVIPTDDSTATVRYNITTGTVLH